jgi:protein ImuA
LHAVFTQKTDIIARLKMDILPLEGLYSTGVRTALDLGLGPVNEAFPQGHFPLGAIHEFLSDEDGQTAASAGFIAALIAPLMKNGGAALWIGSSRTIFPPALKLFGIEPERFVFIDLHKEHDVCWAIEEALKCNGLAAVVGEMPELSFTVSRRFQLAVEQSRVTGFMLRTNPRNIHINACVSRWKIKSLPTLTYEDLPGLGFPRWQVELQKIRNGKPGIWQMEYAAGQFRHLPSRLTSIKQGEKRKTG